MGKDGTEGGQVFACRSLVASPLSDFVDWILVDSTQRSLPPPSLIIRAWDAFLRLNRCLFHLVFSRVDTTLVFTNFSWLSILEKGLVLILSGLLAKRTYVSFRFHPMLPKRFKWLYCRYMRLVCRCCTKIVCQSQLAADELIRLFHIDGRKIEIVHNWIDIRRFSVCEENEPAEDGTIRIIFVGWMHEKKGVQFLIPAIKLLSENRQDFVLTMCGGGGLFDSLVEQTDRLEIEQFVKFLGWIPNEQVNQLLNESDIFVLPSLAEGMPNSLLQAMACGLPVVTTRVSSIPAIVTDSVNGVLVEPGSPDEISRGLLQLMDSPELRQKISQTNRKQIIENHDISNVWKRVAEILDVQVD